jgi:hypothetical protein
MWILICGFVSINIVTFVIMLRKIQNNSSDLEEEVCSLPLQPPPPMALLEDPLHLGLELAPHLKDLHIFHLGKNNY